MRGHSCFFCRLPLMSCAALEAPFKQLIPLLGVNQLGALTASGPAASRIEVQRVPIRQHEFDRRKGAGTCNPLRPLSR